MNFAIYFVLRVQKTQQQQLQQPIMMTYNKFKQRIK